MKEELELRMYFFVPYQLTGIQQGIQCGHAALEYANRFKDSPLFQDFIDNYKTWVILNGGTTNKRHEEKEIDPECKPIGTLNQIYSSILNFNSLARLDDKIDVEKFYEPDLQDALTSICFICDERVFNKKKYPPFNNYILCALEDNVNHEIYNEVDDHTYVMDYEKWLAFIGGKKNLFLRNLIEGKKLA